jgi:hypothetical protein
MSSIEENNNEFPICPFCKLESTFWVGEKDRISIAFFNPLAFLRQDESLDFPRVHDGLGGWVTCETLRQMYRIWCNNCGFNYFEDDPGFKEIINVAINLILQHGE